MRFLVIFLLILASCTPTSKEDFIAEGGQKCHALVQILKTIETTDDIESAEGELKKAFNALASLLILLEDHDHQPTLFAENPYQKALKEELCRIYELEGGREIIERCQREALFRLESAIDKKQRLMEKRDLN